MQRYTNLLYHFIYIKSMKDTDFDKISVQLHKMFHVKHKAVIICYMCRTNTHRLRTFFRSLNTSEKSPVSFIKK